MTGLASPLPATVSLSGTLAEKLEAAAAIGFDGVEILEYDLLTYDSSPADVRCIPRGLGLDITCFQPFRDFEAMPEPQRSRNLDRAEQEFDVMQALGPEFMLVCSNTNPARSTTTRVLRPIWRRWQTTRSVGVAECRTRQHRLRTFSAASGDGVCEGLAGR